MPAGGGIIQIAAVGRQNDILNRDPNFTLFKTSHNRYTNFSEDFEWQDFNGVISFGAQKSPATISRYGDLITDVHLWVTLPAIDGPNNGGWNTKTPASGTPGTSGYVPPEYYPKAAYWVNAVGYAIMEEVSLEIGSQDIDTLYSDYIFLWEELTQRPGARIRESVGRFDWTETIEEDMVEFASKQRDLFVQIPFFFNKYFLEKGLALPLCALTYHEIKIKVTFARIEDIACVVVQHPDHPQYDTNDTEKWLLIESNVSYEDNLVNVSPIPLNRRTNAPLQPTELTAKLLITYIYLDNDERTSFTQSEHEIIVTTIQRQTNSIAVEGHTQDSLKLYFNHPSNFLLWVVRPHNYKTNLGRRRYSVGHKDRFDYSAKSANPALSWGDIKDPITSSTLRLNSHERWPENMPASFFRVIQPQMKFENVPSAYIYVFCFSIAGGVWNPTSTLNFSRIEHTQLDLKYNNDVTDIQPSDIVLFVESYNLLVIKSGMGGLKYAS